MSRFFSSRCVSSCRWHYYLCFFPERYFMAKAPYGRFARLACDLRMWRCAEASRVFMVPFTTRLQWNSGILSERLSLLMTMPLERALISRRSSVVLFSPIFLLHSKLFIRPYVCYRYDNIACKAGIPCLTNI